MSKLETDFNQAAEDVMTLTKRPDDRTLLRLYGLYKQATQGNIKGKRPGFTDVKGRAKYDAWMRCRGKSQDRAMEAYIQLVKELLGE